MYAQKWYCWVVFATSSKYLLLLLGPYHFCPLLSPTLHEISLGISDFLDEISSLSHSVVFHYFFALITEEDFLIAPCYSLELCIQMLISFLFSFVFASLLFTAICKASPDSHFAFLHFFPLIFPIFRFPHFQHFHYAGCKWGWGMWYCLESCWLSASSCLCPSSFAALP